MGIPATTDHEKMFSRWQQRWDIWAKGLQELSRYLLFLRVPLFFLLTAALLFGTQQVKDVLLAMALEPDWGDFLKAAFFGGVFGVVLWLASRRLSNLRWMRPTRVEGVEEPKVHFMPAWVVWWLPRVLGIGPVLAFAAGFVSGVGWIGSAPLMVVLLLVEAALLMGLLYVRSRSSRTPGQLIRATGLARVVQALRVRSGERDGLFTPRTELLLMGLAWVNLALITVPIARAAYGAFGGGIGHLYVLLLVGAALLAVWRLGRQEKVPRDYWLIFLLLLAGCLALPVLLDVTVTSGVAVPRQMGSIAILFDGLAIILVFASTFYAFAINTRIPLVAVLLVAALALNSFRVNDNHAVRLLPKPAANGEQRTALPSSLPTMEATMERWLNENARLTEIAQATEENPWPLYVVSAQGGGVFAAYHGAKALATITREVPDFPRHLFAISGVSGGSVGASLYVNALDPEGDNSAIVQRVDRAFDADHLSTVLAATLTGDATQRVYPAPVAAWDRALGLELSFSDTPSLREPSGKTLAPISLETPFYSSQLAAAAGTAAPPFLVLNTTEVDSGRRFLLAPFLFPSDATFHEPNRGDGEQEVRTSTAAVLSARFPVITPYAFFDGSPAQRDRRTVDGGYYDNSGAVTGLEIVNAIKPWLAAKGLDKKVEVIPIAIVNRSSFRQGGTDSEDPGPPAAWKQPQATLGFSALDALFSTRDARVGKTLSDFGVRCGKGPNQGLCITLWPQYRILETAKTGDGRTYSIPLGWTLSCQSRAFISSQLKTSRDEALNLPCLKGQGLKVQEAGKSQSPGNFPSFETIVATVKKEVNRSTLQPRPST